MHDESDPGPMPSEWSESYDYRLSTFEFVYLLVLVGATTLVIMMICFKRFMNFIDEYPLDDLEKEYAYYMQKQQQLIGEERAFADEDTSDSIIDSATRLKIERMQARHARDLQRARERLREKREEREYSRSARRRRRKTEGERIDIDGLDVGDVERDGRNNTSTSVIKSSENSEILDNYSVGSKEFSVLPRATKNRKGKDKRNEAQNFKVD